MADKCKYCEICYYFDKRIVDKQEHPKACIDSEGVYSYQHCSLYKDVECLQNEMFHVRIILDINNDFNAVCELILALRTLKDIGIKIACGIAGRN